MYFCASSEEIMGFDLINNKKKNIVIGVEYISRPSRGLSPHKRNTSFHTSFGLADLHASVILIDSELPVAMSANTNH